VPQMAAISGSGLPEQDERITETMAGVAHAVIETVKNKNEVK